MAHALKIYRAVHNKTLAALAVEVRSTAATLSRIENGAVPSPELAMRIEEVTKGEVPRHVLRSDLWSEVR